MNKPSSAGGLAGIVAAQTALSSIDGAEGALRYRGYDIHDLAGRAGYTEAVFLLWTGELPTSSQLAAFDEELAAERPLADGALETLRRIPDDAHPMAALRTTVSVMGNLDPDAEDSSPEADRRKAARLVAKLPTAIATLQRLRSGLEPIEPDPELGHAANFLYMVNGEPPDETATRALDTSLTLYLDHGFNASTFTCRVIASTLSDMHSAVTGGLAALKGPLHGGANERAMRMLLEIDETERVGPYVDAALAEGRRLMGFGHRVYKTEDPRASHLRKMSAELGASTGAPKWHELASALEETVWDRKRINSNVDFFCATVYYYLGLPLDLYTPLFAAGRIGGWTAHIMEQHADNRLIRPRADYVGETDRVFIPIDQRT